MALLMYSVSEILKRVGEGRIQLDGHWVRVGRFEVYRKKGTRCVSCGLEGTLFRLDRCTNDGPAEQYHLNLYGVKDGQLVLMTRDHIIPASRGGSSHYRNLQPMCLICNGRKGNYLPTSMKLWLTVQEISKIRYDVRKRFRRIYKVWAKAECAKDYIEERES